MTDEMELLLDEIGNKNRRDIIEMLRCKPCYLREIQRLLSLNPKVVNSHLKRLKDAGFISSFHLSTGARLREYYYLKQDVVSQIIQPKWIVEETDRDTLSLSDTITLFNHLVAQYRAISYELDIIYEKQYYLKNKLSEVYISDSANYSEKGIAGIEIAVLLDFLYGSQTSNLDSTYRTVHDLETSTNYTEVEITAALVSLIQKQYITLTPEKKYCLRLLSESSASGNIIYEIIALNQQKQSKEPMLSVLHDDLNLIHEKLLKILQSGDLMSDERQDIVRIISGSSFISYYEMKMGCPDDSELHTDLNDSAFPETENNVQNQISKLMK